MNKIFSLEENEKLEIKPIFYFKNLTRDNRIYS